jgi:hypothetical protein
MTTDRDPEIGSILDEVEAAAGNVLNPVVSAGGAMADAASSIMSEFFDGGASGGVSGGESGGGGSTDPWDPTPALPDPTPEFEIPPELQAIINAEVDPNEPWRIN